MHRDRITLHDAPAQESREQFRKGAVPDDVYRFVDFVSENEELIREYEERGWSLEDIVYDMFYSADSDTLPYVEGGPGVQEYIEGYDADADSLISKLKSYSERFPLKTKSADGWIYTDVNDGTDTNSRYEIGRHYFNLNLGDIQRGYLLLLKKLVDGRFHAKVKIASSMTVEEMNRPEKMVLYVNDFLDEDSEQALLDLLEELTTEHPDMFDDSSVPKMSERVVGSDGRELPGIAFGQEPGGGRSFGEVRSGALADIIRKARHDGMEVSSADFDIEKVWPMAAKKYGIDVDHPAFNEGSEAFPVLRERLRLAGSKSVAA